MYVLVVNVRLILITNHYIVPWHKRTAARLLSEHPTCPTTPHRRDWSGPLDAFLRTAVTRHEGGVEHVWACVGGPYYISLKRHPPTHPWHIHPIFAPTYPYLCPSRYCLSASHKYQNFRAHAAILRNTCICWCLVADERYTRCAWRMACGWSTCTRGVAVGCLTFRGGFWNATMWVYVFLLDKTIFVSYRIFVSRYW